MLLALALGPVIAALIFRVVPGLPHNWDDPLLALAIVWFVTLFLVIIPARLWDGQQKRIEELQAELQAEASPLNVLRHAQISHSTMNFYLADQAGRVITSAGSNTVIQTPEYDAVVYPGGTVSAQAQAAIGQGAAHDATPRIETGD